MDDDVLYIGPCPAEEDAVQIGEPDYPQRAKAQCRAFIEGIRKTLGHEPEGARLSVASQPHDFGSYYEVVVRFGESFREHAAIDAGHVQERVDAAVVIEHFLDEPFNGWLISHIAHQSLGADSLGGIIQGGRIAAGDDDLGAALDEAFSKTTADAPTTA